MAKHNIDDALFFLTIRELNQRLVAKEFSCVELARAFTERMEKIGPRYNALALLLPKHALKMAKDVDWELKADRTRSPLQGIPYGVKDLLSVEGQPTTWGAPPYAAQVFDYTATAITKLDNARGVLTSKLAMIELAGGGGYHLAGASLQGPGRNPWDRTRWAGGSSSGPAIAVAAGLVTYALGSETSGSIITPAAFCGITGLRPTYGLVSRYGAMSLSWSMDKIGPMCRSADDCGIVLDAIAGKDTEDPGSAGKSFYYAPQYARKMPEIRVGFATVDFDEWPAPEARPAFAQALADIRSLGVQVTAAKLPDFPYGALTGTIISAEGSAVFEPLVQSGKVDQLADMKQAAGLRAGLQISAKDYLRAMRIRSLVQASFRELFADVDVLLTPARMNIAPPISGSLDRPQGPELPKPADPGLTALTPAGNLAGLPALALPCGFVNGMPVGIQLVGRPFSENTLLAVGREYQKKTDWHRRRPPVAEAS